MSELLSMAQQFKGLPMKSLIGGPLNAAAKANANMAWTQTEFLLTTCFENTTVNGQPHHTPIMINMTLDRSVVDEKADPISISTATTTFALPLLTIVPLNSLAVEKVDITFEMQVKSSSSSDSTSKSSSEEKGQMGFTATAGIGPFSVSVHGSASYDHKDSNTHSTHYQSSNSAKYTVNVQAGQLPLPKGVTTIIDAYSKAIQPIEVKAAAPAPPPKG